MRARPAILPGMPTLIMRGQAIGPSDPRLVFYHCPAGTLIDPYSLEFQIFETATESHQLAPVQVYPATPGQRAAVDVTGASADRLLSRPIGADDTALDMAGCFCAIWTPGATEPYGRHEIRWFWKRLSTSPEQTCTEAFDIATVTLPAGKTIYALLSEIRDEGVAATGTCGVSDTRLVLASIKAAAFIEKVTRRFFEPRFLDLAVDGKNSGAVMLSAGTPIIGIDSIRYATTHLLLSSLAADASSYRVYSRHLSEGLLQPDDRDNPRIELYGLRDYTTIYSLADLRFPRGQQNVRLAGVFGYTEPDGSPWGGTPALLREAAIRLAIRYAVKVTDMEAAAEQRFAARITSERTRDQAITYGAGTGPGTIGGGASVGVFSGDPAIDALLALFLAPPDLGAALCPG